MRSKTSRKSPPAGSRWKEARACAEPELVRLAAELARELQPGDRVLLEGPMGAGKTTFARALLGALGVRQPPEGSPSFAIAHEYSGPRGGVVHLDFYRLRSESEIDDAGIPDYFWGSGAIVIAEWLSLFAKFERRVRDAREGELWRVSLSFSEGETDRRELVIERG